MRSASTRQRGECACSADTVASFSSVCGPSGTTFRSRRPTPPCPSPAAITVVQLGYANDVNLAASRLCAKVDLGWAASIGVSAHPALPRVANITAQQNVGGLASFVLDTPYSIGFVSPVAVRVSLAQLVNQAGKSVAATPATVSQATLELIANGILAGGNGFDLSNAQSAFAWPVSVKKKKTCSCRGRGRRALPLLPPPLLSDCRLRAALRCCSRSTPMSEFGVDATRGGTALPLNPLSDPSCHHLPVLFFLVSQQHGRVRVHRPRLRPQHLRRQGRGAQVPALGQPEWGAAGARSGALGQRARSAPLLCADACAVGLAAQSDSEALRHGGPAVRWGAANKHAQRRTAIHRPGSRPNARTRSLTHRRGALFVRPLLLLIFFVPVLFFLFFFFIFDFQMYESPVVSALAEGGNIALLPSLYLKQSGLLDQMRREILCDGDALLQADSTSASVRGNAIIAASVSLITQLYKQVDPSTSTRKHEQRARGSAQGQTRGGTTARRRAAARALRASGTGRDQGRGATARPVVARLGSSGALRLLASAAAPSP